MTPSRFLITGAAGFLGSHLTVALLNAGHHVHGYDVRARTESPILAAIDSPRVTWFLGDVRDAGALKLQAVGCDWIIHYAERKIPRHSSSLETLDVNVQGTENALEAAREHGARFLLGSTEEVYGRGVEENLNEECPLVLGQSNVNRWSLSTSKIMAEHLCFAYQAEYDLPVTILRYFVGYGAGLPDGWGGGVLAVFLRAALAGDPLIIHGDGLQRRTLTHVEDLVRGTVLALESPYADGEIFNLGSQDVIRVIDLAYLIWRLAKVPRKPERTFVPYTDFSRHYEDVTGRTADISKARYVLGYEPSIPLEAGVSQTLAWFRQNGPEGVRL